MALSRHHHEPLAARDPGVEEVALEEEEVLHGQGDDHRGEFRPLALVDADGVGGLDLVELVELVDRWASVELDAHLALVPVD